MPTRQEHKKILIITGVAIVAGAILFLRLLTWEWSGNLAKDALAFPIKPGQDLWQFWQETKNKFQTDNEATSEILPKPGQSGAKEDKKWLGDLKTQLENLKK